jgi:hypothetical protein
MHEDGVAAVEWKLAWRGCLSWTTDICKIRTALMDGIGKCKVDRVKISVRVIC